jgi:hypothetical protein
MERTQEEKHKVLGIGPLKRDNPIERKKEDCKTGSVGRMIGAGSLGRHT